ncbi:MAG TPA: hypothetical protein VIS52_09210 [Motiliproteus sp.]
MSELSVIIPLGPHESRLGRLPGDLRLLPPAWEILFVTSMPPATHPLYAAITARVAGRGLRWIEAPQGRAAQQNAGAAVATGEWLWFLHWDSGFDPVLLQALERQRQRLPNALHYCRLQFMRDAAVPMALNSWGANWRSRWLGVPFGDQGFCLPARLFQQLGGFDERAPYGEDHLLVWAAHLQRVPVLGCTAPLHTSARKYAQQGWGRLTLRYQWLWIRQALPCWWRCLWR